MRPIRRLAPWVAAITLFAVGTARAEEPAMSDEAREKARAGVALLDDPDGARYDEALLAFREAYALSKNPNLLANIGLCALKLERDGEAIEAYTEYLAKGTGILASERQQVTNDIKTRKATLATLTLETTPDAVAVLDERTNPVDGKVVRNRYAVTGGKATLGLRAGPRKLTVTAPGHVETTIDIALAPSITQTRRVELAKIPEAAKPAPPTPPPPERKASTAGPASPAKPAAATNDAGGGLPTAVWVGVGVTGALAIGGGVVGALALANKSSFDDANDGSDPAAADELRATGETLNLTTDIVLGASLAGAVTTIVLYAVSGDEPAAVAALPRVRIAPATDGRSFGGLSIIGAF
jgi:hypothetical protein